MSALSKIKVVECGDFISAAYCTKLLSEFGAEVDKIEPLEGDSLRRHGPFLSDIEDIESSGLFIYLNSGKRSIAADIQTSQGQLVVHRLLSKADVFVTNHPLQLRQSIGLDATTLKARYPNLIIVSLSVFGDTGPYALEPSQTIDAYAVSGTAWVIGEPDRAPLSIPFFQADYQAGAHAASAITMALIGRDSAIKSNLLNQSLGASIDISSADIFAVASGTNGLIYLCYGLQKWVRAGRRAFASGGPYPYVILPCKDGAVCLIGRARQEWQRLIKAMGEPAWTQLERYQDLHAMGKDYPQEVDALITPWLMQFTRVELLGMAEKHGFPIGPLRQMEEVVVSDQLKHRQFFRRIKLPNHGFIQVPGVAWKMKGQNEVEDSDLFPVAPRLGEHTHTVLI